MFTLEQLTELELFLNDGCNVPDPVNFQSPHDLEAMAAALDRLMPACKTLLVMYRGKLAE